MTRPAVESALFRARRRLGEEYGELASGARCARIQSIITDADAGDRLGRGDRRRLVRHVAHCDPCRRLAARAGLDVPAPVRRRVAEKLAGLLPLPLLPRLRRGADGRATTPRGGGGGAWMAHLPTVAESMHSGWGKGVAALAALLVAGAGVGISTMPDRADEREDAQRAPQSRIVAPADAGGFAQARRAAAAAGGQDATGAAKRGGNSDPRNGPRSGAGGNGTAAQPATGGGDGAGGGNWVGARNSPSGQELPRVAAPNLPTVDAPGVKLPDLNKTADDVRGALPDVNETVPDLPAAPSVPETSDLPSVPNVPSVPDAPAPPVNVPNPPSVPAVPAPPVDAPNVPVPPADVPDVPGLP